jgi:hypothetical protein
MDILFIFFLFKIGFVQCVSSIKCYTCSEDGFFCSLPLNFEGDEEYDEHGINSSPYDSDHVCQVKFPNKIQLNFLFYIIRMNIILILKQVKKKSFYVVHEIVKM